MSGRWIVVQTKAGRERWAAENIARQQVQLYMPQVADAARFGFRQQHSLARVKPLFPRYLFVLITDRWRFLLGTFGVSGVLMGTHGPLSMPEREILRIKSFEDGDGLVVLPEKVASGARFSKDQSVRVKSGPYSGYYGIHQNSTTQERHRVLLDVLGRKVPVLFPEEQLEVA